MNFYCANSDIGRKKRFSYGCLVEDYPSELKLCPECDVEWSMPGFGRWFTDASYALKIYMDRDYHSDFTGVMGFPIVSDAAKIMLMKNFRDSVDFGDIEMIAEQELTEELKENIRVYHGGSRALKSVSNNPPQYYRLFLKCGADLDLRKTNIELTVDCPECGRKDYATPGSIIMDDTPPHIIESTWKRYDVFNVEAFGNTIFCTERFVESYYKSKLTGLEFEQIPVV